jgi:4-hydroxy-tetrahydrodipicolinate synthase
VADLANATILQLAEIPNIAGLKDATSDLTRPVDLRRRLPRGREFGLYSGNDDTGLAHMLVGGNGVISVTANVAPKAMSEVCAAALAGNIAVARERNARLMTLHATLFAESNPIPVKWALAAMGRIEDGLRLPLTSGLHRLRASGHESKPVPSRSRVRRCGAGNVGVRVILGPRQAHRLQVGLERAVARGSA